MGNRRMVVSLVVALIAIAAPGRAETPVERRLRVLEEQLRDAQEEIKRLRGQVEQQRAIGQATQKQVEQTAEETKTAAAETRKAVQFPDWLKRTTIFGDLRVRHEGFYHQPHASGQVVTARNRERIRARLGLKFALNDEISATIRGMSGDPNNPLTGNETLTGDFTRKHFNLDWAFLTFTPGKSFGMRPGLVTVNGGKFPNPIFRVGQLVFDDDLAPEGFNESFGLLGSPQGPLDQVKIHVLQWTFNEIANKQDGWMFGGQIDPQLHFGDFQVEAGLGQYWWLNPDQIAQALSKNTTAFDSTGKPIANSGFNSSLFNTNLLVTKKIQPPPPKGSTTKPASFTAITGYRSGFNQSDATFAVTLPNALGTQPAQLFGDYVYNWDAATDDAHGVMAGLRLGQVKLRGDMAVTGYYEYLGQEATISSFTYDDFGLGGTNVQGPVVALDYQLLDPLTITLRNHFTNFINRPTGMTNPTLFRTQLDAVLKW